PALPALALLRHARRRPGLGVLALGPPRPGRAGRVAGGGRAEAGRRAVPPAVRLEAGLLAAVAAAEHPALACRTAATLSGGTDRARAHRRPQPPRHRGLPRRGHRPGAVRL